MHVRISWVIAAFVFFLNAAGGVAHAVGIQWLSVDYSLKGSWNETSHILHNDGTSSQLTAQGNYSTTSQKNAPFSADLTSRKGRATVSSSMNRTGDMLSFMSSGYASPWGVVLPNPNEPDGFMIIDARITSTSTASWTFQPLYDTLTVDLSFAQLYNYYENEQGLELRLTDLTTGTSLLEPWTSGDFFFDWQGQFQFAVTPHHQYKFFVSFWIDAWDAKYVDQRLSAHLNSASQFSQSAPEPSTGLLTGLSLLTCLLIVSTLRVLA